MTRRHHRALPLAALLVVAFPAPAIAYVAPGATVVSASLERQELADDISTQVAASGDGRYVAFTTRARNFFADDDPDPPGQFRAGGIFRRDLVSGALQLVAHGELRSEAEPDRVLVRGAISPSLSADGRYVVFSTGEQLVPDDTNGNVDVYLRDMDKPASDPTAYELISRTSAGGAAQYADNPGAQAGVAPGSDVTARHAISADGRFVLFKTSTGVTSDLPAGAGVTTPGEQFFVRDRLAGTTQLITKDKVTGEPVGGGIGGGSISADGSSVAWSGRQAPRQVELMAGEGEDPILEYYFLRRIADGPAARTVRFTGFADPQAPGCAGQSITEDYYADGPCFGPLAQPEGRVSGLISTPPVLSADGRRVAYLTGTAPRGFFTSSNSLDIWITDVQDGAPRRPSSLELTRDAGPTSATNAPIDAIDLSADGNTVAFTTLRTEQLLPTLRRAGEPRASADARDLYLIDLPARTYELATRGLGGAPTDGPVSGLPSVDASGRLAAFVSTASNMFAGDANSRPDAMAITRQDVPPAASVADPQAAGPGLFAPSTPVPTGAPTPPADAPPLRLTVKAKTSRRGKVKLTLTAPQPLTGKLVAKGTLRDARGRKVGKSRTLAARKVALKQPGKAAITVTIAKKLRRKLKAGKPARASVRLQLSDPQGRDYLGRVTVTFRW